MSDSKTGHFPSDIDKVGEVRVDMWDFHQDLKNKDKALTDSLVQLRTEKCSEDYLTSVHEDVHNVMFDTIGANAICLAEG